MGLCRMQSSRLALLIAAILSVAPLAAAQQDVKFVQTAEDFQEAVTLGIRHIVIERHLDLRTLPAAPAAEVPGARLVITSKTKSIRGDCTGIQPTGFTLDPRATSVGQCVLTVNSPVIELSSINSELLLSDVYVRLERTPAEMESFVPLITVKSGSVWVTTSVFRGDRTKCRAVDIHRGQKFHARKAYFVGFEAEHSAAVRVSPGARGGFRQCTFNINAATLHGSSVGMDSGSDTDLPSACWFQSCIFSSNTDRLGYAVSQTDRRALHYNNRDFQKSVDAENGVLIVPDPLNFEEISALGFLIAPSTADSYQQIALEQAQLTDLKPVEIEEVDAAPPTSTDSGGPKIGAMVGGIAGGVVLIAVAIAAFVIVRQRRRRQLNDQKYLTEPTPPHGREFKQIMCSNSGSCMAASGRKQPWEDYKSTRERSLASLGSMGHKPYSSKETSIVSDDARPPPFQGLTPGHGHIGRDPNRSYLSVDKTITNRSGVSSFTHVANSVSTKMDCENLEEALDDIHESRILFLGRFELHSQVHRRVGGQGIVQPARGRYDEEEYAIKFFLNRTSFEREEALYLREDLRRMMPAVKDIVPNSDGTIVDTAGRVFPPAIVIERGEPLDEWALRIEPDFPTILTVLCHILARLQQLHSAGIAHRDIKPGNVLWRPKHHSWTLIDFGCAAEIGVNQDTFCLMQMSASIMPGQTCPLSLSLLYAAPEAVQGLEAGQRTMIADPASDMWALGVISFELLTASRAFSRSMNADDIRDAIAGRTSLPWETHDFRKKHVPELRMLRRSVLSCLNRNPQHRPTSTALLQQWNGLFDHATKGTLTEEVGQDSPLGRPVDR